MKIKLELKWISAKLKRCNLHFSLKQIKQYKSKVHNTHKLEVESKYKED